MPQSLAAVYVHGVFSTHERRPFLTDAGLRRELQAYSMEVSSRLDCPVIQIGGVEDHIHLLVRLSRTISIAEWIKETKRVSSQFMKPHLPGFAWQAGYGAFSISAAELPAVIAYVTDQEEHHKKFSFQEEFRQLLKEHGMEWDERYVWQ